MVPGSRKQLPLIVIGASAGGIEPLVAIIRNLPADLPAASLVVVHGPPNARSGLPTVLSRAGALPATHPEDGEQIRAGRVYVAVPDRHLLVEDGVVRLGLGPPINRTRPAIDPLFQSAAASHGAAVIGVILSGSLDDGTAGLAAIKRHGGVTVVQDPDEALVPGMPLSALKSVGADVVLGAEEIGPALAKLVEAGVAGTERPIPTRHGAAAAPRPRPVRPAPRASAPDAGSAAVATLPGEVPSVRESLAPIGLPVPFGCPDCGGTLWEIETDGIPILHCRVGHRYSPEGLLSAQDQDVERGLWQAFRALEEQAALARELGRRAAREGQERAARRFAEQEAVARRRAESIRQVILAGAAASSLAAAAAHHRVPAGPDTADSRTAEQPA